MTEILPLLLKITVVIFMAGNLLDLGLRINIKEALRGLRDVRFVTLSVLWAFVLCPALAYGLTLVIPLTPAFAMGFLLLSLAPCAPLLPMLADKARSGLDLRRLLHAAGVRGDRYLYARDGSADGPRPDCQRLGRREADAGAGADTAGDRRGHPTPATVNGDPDTNHPSS